MADHYIHSTAGQTLEFVQTRPVSNNDVTSTVIRSIRVAGGAWVLNNMGRVPRVCITPVTDDELDFLVHNETFLAMKKRGFFSIHTVDRIEADSRDLPADHEKKDNCSQILDEDHANGTDPRCDHAATRAGTGENNEYHGKSPVGAESSNYGTIV